MSMRLLSIRSKLIITFGVVVLLILVVTATAFVGVVYLGQDGDLPMRDLFTAQQRLRSGAAEISAALTAGAGEDEVRRIAGNLALPAVADWSVLTFDGRIVADKAGRVGQRLAVEEVLSWQLQLHQGNEGRLRVNEAIYRGGQLWGLFVVALPAGATGGAGPFGPVLIGGPLVGLLVSLILFWLFGRNLVQPIRQLSVVVGRIAGGDLHVRTNLKPRNDELGQLAQDIDRMALRLDEAQSQAAAADQARRYLVAAVSHDLRTPLTALLANVEALRSGVADDAERSLAVVQEKALSLKRLIDDLFELAALDAAPERWQTVRVDLAELVRRAVVAVWPELEAEGMAVEAEIPEEPLYANLAPGKVERVLDNLLANARKYGAAGAWLGIRVARQGEALRVEVADRGPGLPPEEREQVFERFYRTDSARTSTRAGAGLGLTIAREIVQRHGGQIGVESPDEGGVRFWFELPAA
ncbi:MAG: sensor histidine kinase [Bacillota bacterium]